MLRTVDVGIQPAVATTANGHPSSDVATVLTAYQYPDHRPAEHVDTAATGRDMSIAAATHRAVRAQQWHIRTSSSFR
jgi:hypothetical protein